ncbi:MAG: UGSC family (seleno)protein, partial [Burkholderiales bacterium]
MERLYVLNPAVDEGAPDVALAAPLSQLRNAKIALVDNSKVNADLFLSHVGPRLESDYGARVALKVRKLAPKDSLSEAELKRLAECDAVIQGFGDCGTSTSMSVADGVRLEALGIPTVTLCSSAFSHAARSQAAGHGLAALPIVEIPHPMHTAPKGAVMERAESAVPHLAAALTQRSASQLPQTKPSFGPELPLDLSPDAVQELFFDNGWTDGLPVVPPTRAAVRAMVAASRRDAAETIGPIPPRMRTATIEKLAINAVMAGCRPDYFPVVLAALGAALEDDCRLYGIQTATNNGTPLVIVNGPIVAKLGLNARGNVFGQGFRANATIGRALQLILRNVGGDLPGDTDMSTQGQPGKLTFCIAENEAESPWPPLHVERGFDPRESAVTVVGASAGHNVFTYGCETGREIIDHLVGAMTALGHNNVIFPTGPLLVIGPEHAGVLARDGYDKPKIREHIFRHARIPLTRFAERTVRGLKHRRSRWFE